MDKNEIENKKVYVVTYTLSQKAHTLVDRFKPELPDDMMWGRVPSENLQRTDSDAQNVLKERSLVLNTRTKISDELSDLLYDSGNYFLSPAFRDLCEELETGVQRYFSVRVVSEEPIGGTTDHGTYYWLRPPPIIDCLVFPETKTIADVQGDTWSKDKSKNRWGGDCRQQTCLCRGKENSETSFLAYSSRQLCFNFT